MLAVVTNDSIAPSAPCLPPQPRRPPVDHLYRAERHGVLRQDLLGPVDPGPTPARSRELIDPLSIPRRRLRGGAVGGGVECLDLLGVDRIARAAQVPIEDDRGAELLDGDRPELL